MRLSHTLTLILLLCLASPLLAQVRYPTAVWGNTPDTGLRIDGTTLNFTLEDRDRAGSFLIHNFRNDHWPPETNIGWDRYGDYWILGEFEPAFRSGDKRSKQPSYGNFCLFHGFYSIYVTYSSRFGLAPGHPDYTKEGFFQFGFYKSFADTNWYSAYTDTAVFAPGDRLRYAARHRTTDPRGITLWVRNVTDGVTWMAESADYNDLSGKPEPVRDIRIGGDSHGNLYDLPGKPQDPWYGRILETVLGQGVLDDQSARAWLRDGVLPGEPCGAVLFQQTRAGRETMIPLNPWVQDPGTSGCLHVQTFRYPYLAASTGVHPYLDHRPCDRGLPMAAYCDPGNSAYTGTCNSPSDPETARISFPAGREIAREDLTRSWIEFAFRVPFWGTWRDTLDQAYSAVNFKAASFRVRLEDDEGNTGELRFVPEENLIPGRTHAGAGVLTLPIPSPGNRFDWRYVTGDLLENFRGLHPSATQVTVLEVSATGYVQIADIVLGP